MSKVSKGFRMMGNRDGYQIPADKVVCDAIEALLNAATGRLATGDIGDVLTRMCHHSDPYTLASCTTPMEESDAVKLRKSIWCFLTWKDVDAPLGIVATDVGLSADMSTFEFFRRYGRDFVYQTQMPAQIGCEMSVDAKAVEVRLTFEEYLVGILVLYQLQKDGEVLSISSIMPGLVCSLMPCQTQIAMVRCMKG